MRYILLIFSGLLFSFSAYAQDLNYKEVLQAFSQKELPKSKQIKSYQAIDNKVYSIGDKLQIGYPKDEKKFSYISNAPSNLPTSVVTIQSFVVMGAIAGAGSAISIGAVVFSIENNKSLFINNIDLALEYGEVVRTTKSNVTNFQEMATNSNSSQVTTNHTSYQAVDNNISEPVVTQKTNNQLAQDNSASAEQKVVYFDSPTPETSTSIEKTQERTKKFSNFEVFKQKESSNNFVGESQTKGYGGIVYVSGGFDAYNIGGYFLATIINGYHFDAHWYLGGGIGIKYYDYHTSGYYGDGYYGGGYYEYYYSDSGSAVSIPMFAYGKYTFSGADRKIRPYVSLAMGVNVIATPGGAAFYIEPSAGVSFRLKEKSGVNVAFTIPMSLVQSIGIGLKVGYCF